MSTPPLFALIFPPVDASTIAGNEARKAKIRMTAARMDRVLKDSIRGVTRTHPTTCRP